MLRPKRAVDECLLLSELLPRHAFKGELAELSGLLSWVEQRAAAAGSGAVVPATAVRAVCSFSSPRKSRKKSTPCHTSAPWLSACPSALRAWAKCRHSARRMASGKIRDKFPSLAAKTEPTDSAGTAPRLASRSWQMVTTGSALAVCSRAAASLVS